MPYELYYWPMIQGRGEFVRLALEEAGADYVDIAREPDDEAGMETMMGFMGDKNLRHPPFAPPFLKDGDVVVAQTAAILLYLGPRLNLAPEDEAGRIWTHQIQLTIADIVAEAHDTHHPVGVGLYYEDQKAEAARRSEDFRKSRIPKYLSWFETVLERNTSSKTHLVGRAVTYADLSLFQLVDGLTYAFPKATKRALAKTPHVAALHEAVARRPRIAAYLASDRRIPFNQEGIFRHYPELDG
ncbi:glutathione S-transferase [Microvirga pudoricolor]|uniref:glutathione S-transferase n=1 Tax=Microvirga pudoricolor TaxID=2778729 RepID=UPI00194F3011|nr:glutathione S-transferase [Microvirga pudoricolor]MBM6594686.1 glutathione S-transferase [Microvirga pudoricolor]